MLFLQGGASLQFSMVPMNLLAAGASADYIVTGVVGGEGGEGSEDASATVNDRGDDRGGQFTRVPDAAELKLTPGRRVRPHDHEQHDLRHAMDRRCRTSATCRSSADTSSDMFSRPIDVTKHGLIYAGAQKNLALIAGWPSMCRPGSSPIPLFP